MTFKAYLPRKGGTGFRSVTSAGEDALAHPLAGNFCIKLLREHGLASPCLVLLCQRSYILPTLSTFSFWFLPGFNLQGYSAVPLSISQYRQRLLPPMISRNLTSGVPVLQLSSTRFTSVRFFLPLADLGDVPLLTSNNFNFSSISSVCSAYNNLACARSLYTNGCCFPEFGICPLLVIPRNCRIWGGLLRLTEPYRLRFRLVRAIN